MFLRSLNFNKLKIYIIPYLFPNILISQKKNWVKFSHLVTKQMTMPMLQLPSFEEKKLKSPCLNGKFQHVTNSKIPFFINVIYDM